MQLNELLSSVTALAFDKAPLIYFVERYPTYVDLMREIIRHIDVATILGCSSVVTLTEVLAQPLRVGNIAVQTEYRDLLLHSRNFKLIPIDSSGAKRAADLRVQYNLRPPDALQIATALTAGCEAFFTSNLALKRVKELRVIILEELVSTTNA